MHEHAEANDHKNNGLSAILAGHAGGLKTGLHTEVTGTIGDVYLTLADEVLRQPLGAFPTGDKKLPSIV